MIPYGRQSIDDDDIAAVVKVLKGDRLTRGPYVDEFEEALAERVGARFAVAFANGTAALHAAAAAAELDAGDVVVTSPLSFAASANCIRYVGATPGFVDIDPATLNLDTDQVPHDCAGVVAVHYAGLPMDLTALAHRPPLVIEDAAHALGAMTPDGPVGNCAHSDMTCFSFHPVKPITTGEGGMVTTNDDDLAERLRRFRSHGTERRPENGGWYYEVTELGMNYRLSDIASALGLSQLDKLSRFIDRRQELAANYDSAFAGTSVTPAPAAPAGFSHGYHLYPVRVPDRRNVYDGLREAGVAAQVHYVPIHRHPIYQDKAIALPHADEAYEGLLSLPMFPTLSDADQRQAITSLLDLVG